MKARLLVVDQEPEVLELVNAALTPVGHVVHSADDSEAALQSIQSDRPELVLLSAALPGTTTKQFCEKMASRKLNGMPIVLMLEPGERRLDDFSSVRGIAGYINKPFTPEALAALCEYTLLHFARQRRQPAPAAGPPKQVRLSASAPPGASPPRQTRSGGATAARENSRGLVVQQKKTNGAPSWTDELIKVLRSEMERKRVPAEKSSLTRIARAVASRMQSIKLGVDEQSLALWSDIEQVPLPEILQLLQLQGHTGLLELFQNQSHLKLYLREGHLICAQSNPVREEYLLGRFLAAQNKVAEGEIEQILSQVNGHQEQHLVGESLVDQKRITRTDLLEALNTQACEFFYDALCCHTGTCRFIMNVEPEPRYASSLINISVQGLLLEAMHRDDEWGVIEQEVENLDVVFAQRYHRSTDDLDVDAAARLVFEAVDGRRSVREICRLARLIPIHCCKHLFELSQKGHIVRIVSPA